ncbi:MAG: glutamate ABC transporter substrate-binding protein [Thermocrispum sp.]
MTKAQDSGQLTIGVRFTQPGLSERTLDGRFVGFDIDVARFVAAQLGVDRNDIIWRDVLAGDREKALSAGTVDLVISTYSITEKRKKRVLFAGPYFVTGQSVLVRLSTTDITGPDSLDGKKLCSVAGTTSAEEVKRRFSQRVRLVEYPRDPDCVTALLAGLVDAVTTDEAILAGYVAQHPELLKVVGEQFSEERYGIGLQRDDVDGRRAVNAALQEMIDSGEWRRSVQRHLGRSGIRIPDPPPITER